MALIRTGGGASGGIGSMTTVKSINQASGVAQSFNCKRGGVVVIAGRDNRWSVSGLTQVQTDTIGNETDSAVTVYTADSTSFTFTPNVGTLTTTIMYETA